MRHWHGLEGGQDWEWEQEWEQEWEWDREWDREQSPAPRTRPGLQPLFVCDITAQTSVL